MLPKTLAFFWKLEGFLRDSDIIDGLYLYDSDDF